MEVSAKSLPMEPVGSDVDLRCPGMPQSGWHDSAFTVGGACSSFKDLKKTLTTLVIAWPISRGQGGAITPISPMLYLSDIAKSPLEYW